jgi:hypothetical protein
MDNTIKNVYIALLGKKEPLWDEALQGRVITYLRLFALIQLTNPVAKLMTKYNTEGYKPRIYVTPQSFPNRG